MFNLAAGGNSRLRSRMPYWDAPYYSGMDLVFDAQKGGFRNDPAIGLDLSTLVSDVHSSAILAPDASDNYQTFAANVLARTNLGIQTVPTRSNLLRNSSALGAVVGSPGTLPTNWFNVGGAGGIAREIVGAGTVGGLPYVDVRFSGTATAASSFGVQLENSTQIAASVGQIWAGSIFVALVSGSFANLNSVSFRGARGYTAGGATTTDGQNLAVSGLTLTLQRFSHVVTLSDPTTAFIAPQLVLSFNSGAIIDVTFRIACPQLELGAFASAPILTTGSASTVNGNRQFISGLGSQLATGVAGFVQVDSLVLEQDRPLLSFTNGTVNERFVLTTASAGSQFRFFQSKAGSTTDIAAVTAGRLTGIATIAFCLANNYSNYRVVGSAQPGPGTTLPAIPTLDRLALGGLDYSNASNAYQRSRKLALDFLSPSDDPATVFSRVYNQAVLAAAA